MTKIGIAIPSPQMVYPDFALQNLPEIIAWTKKNLPDVELYTMHQGGVRTDKNRNVIVKHFLELGVDWILHLDADMIYPKDIIKAYLDADKLEKVDVIGAYYFKRSYPFTPVAYVKNNGDDKSTKPYRPMLPPGVHKGEIYECDGLGFGGMFVGKHVYDGLGKEKWCVYGKNFHIPEENKEHGSTHDLNFCKSVKRYGFSVKLHGSVRPGHIGTVVVGEEDYVKADPAVIKKMPRVLVIMPHINDEMSKKTGAIMKHGAGMTCDILLIEDKKRQGFVKTVNDCVNTMKDYDLYVYTAQDAFVSKGWCYEAVMEFLRTGAGVIAFNDGKWGGKMAQFGMVSREWIDKFMGGKLFPDMYQSNYCDVELTQLAKAKDRFAWAEKAIMMEIDYEKDFKGKINKEDRKLYIKRAKTGFDGWTDKIEIMTEFG